MQKWDDVYSVKSIITENDIYLIIYQPLTNSIPEWSDYDILLFDEASYTFRKSIAVSPKSNTILLHANNPEPNNNDLLYIGNNKVLSASVCQHVYNSTLIRYESELKILDLITGDIQFITNLPFKGKNHILLNMLNNNIYAMIDDHTDSNLKVYRLDLLNINNQVNQSEDISLVEQSNKLYALWSYGNPFDGRWDDTNKKIVFHTTRKNQCLQIAPSIGSINNISDNYIGRNVSVNGNYLSTDKFIGELDADFNLSKIVYQPTNIRFRPFHFIAHGSKYVSALTNFLSDTDSIEILLLDNEMKHNSIIAYTDTPKIASFNDEIIMIGNGMNTYDSQHLITKLNLETGQQSSISFGSIIDPITYLNRIDINQNKYVVVVWNSLVAMGAFSDDIIKPEVQIVSTDTSVEKGSTYRLTWNCSDNLDELMKYDIYEIIDNQERLLTSINDISTAHFDYTIPETDKSILLKVYAFDSDNNIDSDEILLTPIISPIITSFTINTSQIESGDKVNFSWDAKDSNYDTVFSIYIQKIIEVKSKNYDILPPVDWDDIAQPPPPIWQKIAEIVGRNTISLIINNHEGNYRFKISSGASSMLCDQNLSVKGSNLTFNYDSFYPKKSLSVRKYGANIRFQWGVDQIPNDDFLYHLYIKTDDSEIYDLYAVTNETSYTVKFNSEDLGLSWKIICEYNQKQFESMPIDIIFDKLTSPDIKNLELINNNTNYPTIEIHFDNLDSVNEYVLYRRCNMSNYREITIVSQSPFIDKNIDYDNIYDYVVASKKDNILALPGNSRSISVNLNFVSSILILNENYEILSTNENIIRFQIEPEEGFHFFKISLSENPYEDTPYIIIKQKEVILYNLKYNQTYYATIYPLNHDGKRFSNISSRLVFTTGFDNRQITSIPVLNIIECSYNNVLLQFSRKRIWGSQFTDTVA
ncbi:hypothetical protein MHK_008200, partial [Candidatus Magnetomorum sp. HK-1]